MEGLKPWSCNYSTKWRSGGGANGGGRGGGGVRVGVDGCSESWNWKMTNSHKEGTILAEEMKMGEKVKR